MKKEIYIQPQMDITTIESLHHTAIAGSVPIGGTGGFDTKQEQDWDIWGEDTEEYWNNDTDDVE